jgi:L-2-hydroxycarboxylate dehydrogenase (NAD+)
MSSMSDPDPLLVPAARLRDWGAGSLAAAGMPGGDAALVAGLLVRSDLRGIETHGVRWLPNYCRGLAAGRINPRPDIRIQRDSGALLVVHGDGGFGHLVSARAMEACIHHAAERGAAIAVARNSRHNGAASLYALQAIEAGMIGFSMTGGGVRVAPAGGRAALLGTNPIAFAAPTGSEPPFVMDIATSVVAGARVTLHREQGLAIPPGWALDPDGNATTDPELADRGPLLPLGSSLTLGSYKGFALSLMVETLCNVLTGMASGPERATGWEPKGVASGSRAGMGHFFAAIRVDALQPLDEFRDAMDRNLRILRDCAPAEGVDRVMTPGEKEWLLERERTTNGVTLRPAVVDSLATLAAELGVPPLQF